MSSITVDCTSRCEFTTQTMTGGNNRQACLTCGMLGEWHRPDGTVDGIANLLQAAGLNPVGTISSSISREPNKLIIKIRDAGHKSGA